MKYTTRVQQVRNVLALHLRSGHYRPGERFLSNRALAARHGVSYQTADRLLRDLVDEGLLERRRQSGTYVSGNPATLGGVSLVMHPRAARDKSFGAKLRGILTDLLNSVGEEPLITLLDQDPVPPVGRVAVVWDRPDLAYDWAEQGQRVVLINDRPRLGSAAQRIDSVATDNAAGGALAADLLGRFTAWDKSLVVLAGPAHDPRAAERVAGFTARQTARVVWAADWYSECGAAAAEEVLASNPAGVFACNDRLAEGLVQACRQRGRRVPALVGFDDAPVAAALGLTTIGIPWEEIARGVQQIVTDRLRGSQAAAVRQTYVPQPILRSLGLGGITERP